MPVKCDAGIERPDVQMHCTGMTKSLNSKSLCPDLRVRPARTSEPDVAALIATHFDLMRASSPEDSCHVMEADALEREGAWVFAAEDQGSVVGIGALKEIAPGHGEIKSMHTAQTARGKGVARQVLLTLIDAAKEHNLARLSLETGSADMFAPARQLYAAEGFSICPPFADYTEDPLSTFMTREV